MKKVEEDFLKLRPGKAVGACFLAIAVLVLAQFLALFISLPLPALGLPGAVCNIIAGLMYAGFSLAGALLLSMKFLRLNPAGLRLNFSKPETLWLISALLMPALVLLAFTALGGRWTVSGPEGGSRASLITGALVYYGLAAGLGEELIFRGIIMGSLERAFNIKLAVVLPSVLFGALHIIGGGMSLLSAVQLLIAGTMVGVLFSLVTWESGSVWNAALVHGVWNAVFAGGLVHVGNTVEADWVFSLVLNSGSRMLTGGEFGAEASLISFLAYVLFALLALVLGRKKYHRQTRA